MEPLNITKVKKIENYSMVYMNVYYVLAALQVVQVTGGIQIDIQVQLFLCKPIDGLQTLEMNTEMKDQKKFVNLFKILAEDIKLEDC